jgi:molybdenum cofactor cytidylyltransferase
VTIVGVIVAAGESTRMGFPKQLLPIGGRPMLQWAVDAAEASMLDQVVVVTGHYSELIRVEIRLDRAIWAHNPDPERGTMSSLRAGLGAATAPDAVMKLVTDQPEVTSAMIDRVISAWDPDRHRVSLVSYQEGPGHPMLFGVDALAEVVEEDGDRRLWELVERHPDEVNRLVVDEARPIDVNSEDDLRLAAERLGYSSGNAPIA